MKKFWIIAKKELNTYFKSPMAYIVLFVTISVFNIFFYIIIEENQEATLRDVFKLMEFMFVFFVPLLTMKVFSEEKANGTLEFLMTTPVTPSAVILGKYLGSLIFFTYIIILTGPYYFILEHFASPDRIAMLVGYFGVWLEGAFFIAVGILVSSWTNNQIVAAINTYMIVFFMYFSLSFIQYVDGALENVIRYLCTLTHAENFSVGIIASSDLIYYISGIAICLILTRLSLENT